MKSRVPSTAWTQHTREGITVGSPPPPGTRASETELRLAACSRLSHTLGSPDTVLIWGF